MCILSAAQRKIINQKQNNIFSLKRCTRRRWQDDVDEVWETERLNAKVRLRIKFRVCIQEKDEADEVEGMVAILIQKRYVMKARTNKRELVNPTEKMNIYTNCIHKYKHEKKSNTQNKKQLWQTPNTRNITLHWLKCWDDGGERLIIN